MLELQLWSMMARKRSFDTNKTPNITRVVPCHIKIWLSSHIR